MGYKYRKIKRKALKCILHMRSAEHVKSSTKIPRNSISIRIKEREKTQREGKCINMYIQSSKG